MNHIKNKFDNLCKNMEPGQNSSDIMEHLPTLYKYANECNSVFETGVRGCVSSWAFLFGLLNNKNNVKKRLLLNDINECYIDELLNVSSQFSNIEVKYIWKNNLEINIDQTYDITFIDTWHIYGQLKRELNKFKHTTAKYIILHDTTIDAIDGETIRCGWNAEEQSRESGIPVSEIKKGLWQAVLEFINEDKGWFVKERYQNNNGLTILARKRY